MTTLANLTLHSFREGLLQKTFSALEITQAFFAHIKEHDGRIGAYLSLNEAGALKAAEKIDLALARGEDVGALAGAPLAVKDNILIEDLPATAASKMLGEYVACYDAGVVEKLKRKGAVFLGKTNLDEFAMGSSTENSAFKVTKNPHNTSRVPGGSSGGSCAAVAAHMALAALGSDTGGSIRQPASFCGVAGLKPTYGAVSRSGLIAMASSLDQIGPIAKTVEDVRIVFNAIRGHDPHDATSVPQEEEPAPALEDMRKFTIGLPEEYFIEGLEKEVQNAVDLAIHKLESIGISFKKVSLPHTKYALSCYYIIMPAEVSANLSRFDGIRYARIPNASGGNLLDVYLAQRGLGFGAEAKRRVILGTFVLSSGYYDAYYEKAQRVRTLVAKDFEHAFEKVDMLLTPVAPTRAFTIGEKTGDPLAMYLSDIFTIPVNLAGLPALSIPIKPYRYPGNKELPVGFQLIGKHFRETDILGVGEYYEKLEAGFRG